MTQAADPPCSKQFRFERAVDHFGQRVVEAVAAAGDRWFGAGVCHALIDARYRVLFAAAR